MGSKRSLPSPAAAFLALTLIVPLLAGGVLVFVASTESPLTSAGDPVPVVATVLEAERHRAVHVSIKSEASAGLTVVGQTSGTVTQLAIATGDTVADGQVVLTVDSRKVIAYVSASPLYRDIARSQTGADIKVAQRLLKRLRLLGAGQVVDGKVNGATEAAIKAFNKKYGYGSGNGVLSLTSLVWLGPLPARVAAMKVTLGATAGPGTVLFDKSIGVGSLVVTETLDVPRDAKLELVVGTVTVPYVSGSGRINDPDAIAKIAGVLGAFVEGDAIIRLVEPVTVGAVPASAVVADDEGRICFFPGVVGPPTVVEPLAIAPADVELSREGMPLGSVGIVDLDPSLIGQAVLINPRDVREDLSCG